MEEVEEVFKAIKLDWDEFRIVLVASRKDWTSVQIEYIYYITDKEYKFIINGLTDHKPKSIKAIATLMEDTSGGINGDISEFPCKEEIEEVLVSIKKIARKNYIYSLPE